MRSSLTDKQTELDALRSGQIQRPKSIRSQARRPRSWVWLIAAAVLLLFANGASNLPIAAWLAPLFLLRFVRTQRPWIGLPVAYLVMATAFSFQFRGMVPIPGVGYYVFLAAFGIPLV